VGGASFPAIAGRNIEEEERLPLIITMIIIFFIIKPTDALASQIYFCQENLHVSGQFLCPSSGVFHCTFGTGICHTILMTYTSAECTVENS